MWLINLYGIINTTSIIKYGRTIYVHIYSLELYVSVVPMTSPLINFKLEKSCEYMQAWRICHAFVHVTVNICMRIGSTLLLVLIAAVFVAGQSDWTNNLIAGNKLNL